MSNDQPISAHCLICDVWFVGTHFCPEQKIAPLQARIAELEALLREARPLLHEFYQQVELAQRIDAALGTDNPSSQGQV